MEARVTAGRAAATVALLLFVLFLALLPAAIGLGAGDGLAQPPAAWLGGLALVVVGGKLVITAWGLVMRFLARPRRSAVAAPID